ncbi:MAG: hypothetical protein RB191_02490, partial [Terriglobia bacterium]|nr:hypothetical protein [Terriglobia bacterium]
MMNRKRALRSALLMRRVSRLAVALCLASLLPAPLLAKVVVFWQAGFPTVASQPVEHAALAKALGGMDAQFADVAGLNQPGALTGVDLLVLPYGSAVPADAWSAIVQYLHGGGNLLIVGGQPLRVPVKEVNGAFTPEQPQDSYARVLDFRHTYAVPVPAEARFAWKTGYAFAQTPQVHARRFFAVEGRLDGLGYMVDGTGLLVAAPVIVADHAAGPLLGSRVVALDFDPEPGYWQSDDGVALMRQAAAYATRGATSFSIETLFSVIRPGEPPLMTVHLRKLHKQQTAEAARGEVKLTLSSENAVLDTATLPVDGSGTEDVVAPFHKPLPPGLYRISGIYSEGGQLCEFYENGFWVQDAKALEAGPALGTHGDFLTRDGKPFFPVGTNYFTTEENGWDFSGPRNAWVWDKDFDEMAHHGVSLVRTGVWMPNARFIESSTGGANERFLRNLEAFLLCAQRHGIAVNFTFFAFSPHSGNQGRAVPGARLPNPYTDPASVQAEQAYVRSVVARFKDCPWLSWDLINEP